MKLMTPLMTRKTLVRRQARGIGQQARSARSQQHPARRSGHRAAGSIARGSFPAIDVLVVDCRMMAGSSCHSTYHCRRPCVSLQKVVQLRGPLSGNACTASAIEFSDVHHCLFLASSLLRQPDSRRERVLVLRCMSGMPLRISN